jgi:solute carrier family 50 protein (sugar transporter)
VNLYCNLKIKPITHTAHLRTSLPTLTMLPRMLPRMLLTPRGVPLCTANRCRTLPATLRWAYAAANTPLHARPLHGAAKRHEQEEEQEEHARSSALQRGEKTTSSSKPAVAGAAAAASALVQVLPGGASPTAFAAGAATPAPLVGPALVSFLQVFPPLAAQACFLAPWGTLKNVQKVGDVGDLPLLPYAAMAVNGIGWITYGVLAGEPTIWAPNITAFIFGSYYWYVYAQNTTSSMVPWVGGAASAVAAIGYLGTTDALVAGLEPKFALGLLLNAVVVAMFGGPLGAIKKVMDTQDTSSIPFPFAVATFLNCTTWTAFGLLVIHDPLVWACNLLGTGSAIAQLACHAKYGISWEHPPLGRSMNNLWID